MNTIPQNITTEAIVIDGFGESKYLLELPGNGHQLVGHLPLRLSSLVDDLRIGDGLRIEMTPYDLNKGKIIKKLPCFNSNDKFGD